MELKNRSTLKTYFQAGQMPQPQNFDELIDSMVNKIDDGFSKDTDNGLMLAPEGDNRSLLSFFQSIQDKSPQWTIDLNADDTHFGLCFSEPGSSGVRLFLQKGGNVGIGTINPAYALDVNGWVAMKGRVGTFAKGTIPADGKWHDVVSNLNGCQGFEVVARAGVPNKGRYALLKATALSTFGNSHDCITTTQAHYGWWWNKMRIRFKGSTYNYSLQLRTRCNYGDGMNIAYNISKVWGDEEMGFPLPAAK